jgi:hypothetical protein
VDHNTNALDWRPWGKFKEIPILVQPSYFAVTIGQFFGYPNKYWGEINRYEKEGKLTKAPTSNLLGMLEHSRIAKSDLL